jgi:hypothetical protein
VAVEERLDAGGDRPGDLRGARRARPPGSGQVRGDEHAEVQHRAGGIREAQQAPVGQLGEAAGHLRLDAKGPGVLPGVDDVRGELALLCADLRDEREVLGRRSAAIASMGVAT